MIFRSFIYYNDISHYYWNFKSLRGQNVMKQKILSFAGFILLFGTCVFAQDLSNKTGNTEQELQAKAVEYLRATASEINTLRTNENRISFSSELANLMWFHDEKEARRMFSSVADNFVQLMAEYNSRVEAFGGTRGDDEFFRGFSMIRDERRDAIRRLYKARDVRGQIALAIAEHDPQLAYDFVIRTATVITDQTLADNFKQQNEELERQIIGIMSVQNVESSLAFGRRSLKRGLSTELVQLAAKIYKKDPEAAIEFGKELIEKARSEVSSESKSLSNLHTILETGSEVLANQENGKKPLFEKKTLESIAELLARNLLEGEEFEFRYQIDDYITEIEKYSPSQALRLKAKFAEEDVDSSKTEYFGNNANSAMDDPGSTALTPEGAAEQAREEERLAVMKEVEEFGNNELSSEQKSKFIGKARRVISEMDEPMMKIAALSTLAKQVKRLGDSKLASDIMSEAHALVRPNPRNFLDYAMVWMLASGYAEVEPDEAFPLIEDSIYRLNDSIGAMVKVAEFIDVQGEVVIDGEVQLGSFGGSMTRGVVGMLENSGNVLKSLSIADFERTKALAGKFEKPEVRILARFLVLRSVLQTNETEEIGLLK